MLSNVADMTGTLSAMAADGHPVTPGLVARLSPYMRERIRRFGQTARRQRPDRGTMDGLCPAAVTRCLRMTHDRFMTQFDMKSGRRHTRFWLWHVLLEH